MLGIEFKKASPTIYVMHCENGTVKRAGAGLSFFYFAPTATILDVPLSSIDVPFVFNETTSDFQDATLQGQITYRISDPEAASKYLDFSVYPSGDYIAMDETPIELLGQRLVNAAHVQAKAIVKSLSLKKVLVSGDEIVVQMLAGLKLSEGVKMLGVEIIDLSVFSMKPTPEMARALEAETREALQKQADQAVYMRRNAAVEEERRIKESELNTQIAVEEKQRQIRETKIAADIAIEQKRQSLIDLQVENDRKDADSKAYALEAALKPVSEVDWKVLLAVAARGGDPRFAISLAFQQLAENAGKIGQLTVTPDLLQSLIAAPRDSHAGSGERAGGK